MENNSLLRIRREVLRQFPKEAEITRIEFEGPNLAVYVKKPEFLIEHSYIVSNIATLIKKRIVVRADPSVQMKPKEALEVIRSIVPKEAEVTNISFDPTVGEVIIEAKKPGLVIGKGGVLLQEIAKRTKWRPKVLRAPPLPSKILPNIRNFLISQSKEHERILRNIGERIYRPVIFKDNDVRITTLGGSQQVGRSALLLQTKSSSILIDCGINPGSTNPVEAYPRLDINELDLEQLDAIIISHAHLDHCGFLPFLYKYGYEGPVFCSEPTLSLMVLLQLDYLDVLAAQGRVAPYDQKDVREMILHAIPLRYGVVTDVASNIKITLHNAGHILGSAMIHIHIGEGLHNIVYSGDYKYASTLLLEPAVTTFPRVETFITESTYGSPRDIMPYRHEVEGTFINIVNKTLENSGKVLIPVLAVGRAQEIMLVLDKYIRQGVLKEVPIFIEGMISEVTAIYSSYPDYLSRNLRNKILYEDVNPFQSEYFVNVKSPNDRLDIIEGEPCIILATSGMLEGGPVLEYFKHLAPDEKNTLIFVSYQIEGTLGRRIQNGLPEVKIREGDKVEIIKVKCRVESVEGFSGHSDRNQLISYLRRIHPRPKRVIVNHGEKSKCIGIAEYISRKLNIESIAPANLETIKLI